MRQVPLSVCVFEFCFPLRFGCIALSRMFHGALAGICEFEGLGYFCTEVKCSEGLCIWETPNMTNTKEAAANGREFTGAQETACPWCVYQFSVG